MKEFKLAKQTYTSKMVLDSLFALFILGVGIGASVASENNFLLIFYSVISILLFQKIFKKKN